MQEELLQESGEQMLARVEYALRQEHAAVSWGLPSPRWSLQQDQRNRRWVGWHLCFSIVVGLLCQQLAPENWEGVWWLYWWYVIPTLLCSTWFFASQYLYSTHHLKVDKTYPRTVDGSMNFDLEAHAYWNYAPPQEYCHLYVHRAKLIIECGTKQHIIDLQEGPYQLEVNRGYVLILKPIGAVEGWIIMEVWSRKLDAVAKLLAQRFDWRGYAIEHEWVFKKRPVNHLQAALLCSLFYENEIVGFHLACSNLEHSNRRCDENHTFSH